MIGKLICALPKWMGGGHKRGKRVTEVTFTTTTHLNHYRCTRCGAAWTRKAKPA